MQSTRCDNNDYQLQDVGERSSPMCKNEHGCMSVRDTICMRSTRALAREEETRPEPRFNGPRQSSLSQSSSVL